MATNTAFKSYASEHGGRVIVLFLLFLLALWQFYSAGFSSFATICCLPILLFITIGGFQYRMFTFWALMLVNYLVQWHSMVLPSAIPTSMFNELLEIILLGLAIIDIKNSKFERTNNIMFLALLIWCVFCTIEIFNDTCNLGIQPKAWYVGARLIAFQLLYAFLVYSLYITTPKHLMHYFFVWGGLSLFAVFWVWKQTNFGFTHAEEAWVRGPGYVTHILQGGTLIRYFSVYGDAANFGIGMASTSVAFIIFGITSKIKKHKIIFFIVGCCCCWGMFPSGTRTAIACLIAGLMAYIFLSKSFKIAIPFTILFGIFVFVLAFTTIGNSNQQIRRMRSAFNKNDASANQRAINQETMRKYMKEAPWGIGIGMGFDNVPANNKYRKMATIASDSEYVFIWLRTGIIGISIFLFTTFIMVLGASWIVFFTLKSPSLRGIGAGFTCAFISQQLGGYGNQVLMQFPNCLIFYGGLSIVYILPFIENDWIEYEKEQLAKQEEKKRLKLEKKRASRV